MPELQNLFPEIVFALTKIKSRKNYAGHTATAVPQLQGDQIGQIFANWAIVYNGKVFYITNVAKFLGTVKVICFIILTKKCVGLHFGQFFTNSSGHPAQLSASPSQKNIEPALCM
jgi:hypothetical protein